MRPYIFGGFLSCSETVVLISEIQHTLQITYQKYCSKYVGGNDT
jgi:hypothetical protein